MGKTAFSGPVYGTKGLLASFCYNVTSSQASTALAVAGAVRIVPSYEDWMVTEVYATCSTCSSNAAAIYLKTEGGSTTIAPAPWGTGNGSTRAATLATITSGTSTQVSTNAVVTPTAGEFEGSWVPAGSTLRLVSSANSGIANLQVQVMGYIRYRNSTRAE